MIVPIPRDYRTSTSELDHTVTVFVFSHQQKIEKDVSCEESVEEVKESFSTTEFICFDLLITREKTNEIIEEKKEEPIPLFSNNEISVLIIV